jgi:hypothetical protein
VEHTSAVEFTNHSWAKGSFEKFIIYRGHSITHQKEGTEIIKLPMALYILFSHQTFHSSINEQYVVFSETVSQIM